MDMNDFDPISGDDKAALDDFVERMVDAERLPSFAIVGFGTVADGMVVMTITAVDPETAPATRLPSIKVRSIDGFVATIELRGCDLSALAAKV